MPATGYGALIEVPGAANKLGMQMQPSSSATAGIPFAQQPRIAVQDQFGNTATNNSSAIVTASRSAGTGVLQGTLTATAINGVATFSNLSHQLATTISVSFSSGTLTSATSASVLINPAAASSLIFLTQPENAMAGAAFGTQPAVRTQDQFGNHSTVGLASSLNVTLSLTSGTGILQGTVTQDIGTASGNGTVSFTGLRIDSPGNGKQLTANATGLSSALSSFFAVTNNPPTAANDSATVLEDTSLTISVLANDITDSGETLNITSITQGLNGTTSIAGAGTSVTYQPHANFYGSDSFTYTISDGNGGTSTATVSVTVSLVNDTPTLSGISDITIDEDSTGALSLTGITSGAANENQTLTVTATSSDTSIVPHPLVTYISPNATGSLTFMPSSNANGTATISVVVNDGEVSVTQTFTVTVNAVNDAPTLDGLNNTAIEENAAQTTIMLSGISSGAINENQTLSVTAFSSNTALIPHPTVIYSSPGVNGSLSFTPVANANGSATIRVVVDDGVTSITNSFVVTVNALNGLPALDAIADLKLISGNSQTVTVTGVARGAGNENQTIVVTASSSNPQAATVAVVYSSPEATAQLVVSAGSTSYDTTTITVFVFDGANTVSRSFLVTAGVYKAGFSAMTLTPYSGPISGWLANLRGKATYRDLIVANYLGGTITIRLCNDQGGFLSPKLITIGGQPSGVFAADINGDRYDDIVVSNFSTNSLAVVMNLRNGTYSSPVRYRVGDTLNPGTVAVRTADVNKDGRVDIIAANQSENTVSVLLNANSTFSSMKTYAVGASPNCLGLAELTGDTNLDIYVSTADSIHILSGIGQGDFDTNSIRTVTPFEGGDPQIMQAVAIDLNADGRKDFVTANANSNTVSILIAQTDGSFVPTDYSVGDRPQSLLLRDVNHDGKTDITVANTDSDSLSVLIGQGNGTFVRQLDIAAGDSPVVVLGSNFNSDLATDLAILNYNPNTVRILVFNGPISYAVKAQTMEEKPATITLKGTISQGSLMYRIARAPAHGTLNVSGTFSDPRVTYTPNTNYFGADSFAYCTTTDTMESAYAEVTLNVLAVNDAPSFNRGSDITVLPTARGYTNVWATAISRGPANEFIQKYAFALTPATTRFFSLPPRIDVNGVLRFRVAPNIFGTNILTVRLSDNGGTRYGGTNAAPWSTFKIIVPRP